MAPEEENLTIEELAEGTSDSLVELAAGIKLSLLAIWGALIGRDVISTADAHAMHEALEQQLRELIPESLTWTFIAELRDDLQRLLEESERPEDG